MCAPHVNFLPTCILQSDVLLPSFVCVSAVHAEGLLKGVGRHDNASLETRGWLPWKPQAESSAAGRLREEKER